MEAAKIMAELQKDLTMLGDAFGLTSTQVLHWQRTCLCTGTVSSTAQFHPQ